MSRAALYLWSVNTAGLAVATASLVHLVLFPPGAPALILAALALVSGAAVLRRESAPAGISIGDAFTFSALFLYGVEVATLIVALDSLAISTRLGGTPKRVLFNTAAPSLAMWSAGTLVFGLAGMPLPVNAPGSVAFVVSCALAVGFFFLLGSGFVAAAVALHEAEPVTVTWRRHFAGLWTSPAVGGYIGALVAWFREPFGTTAALIALAPIPLILYQMLKTSLARADDEVRHLGQMNRMYESTIEAFATAVDAKDQVTHGHIRRVQTYSLALARELGITDSSTLKALEAAALLHDVGKIGIPEHILNKPGRLTPAELEVMRQHVTIGADILSTVEFPFPVVDNVRCHHENWDGTGYPSGLRGEDIPIGARILMVVDCFDALTSDRPYRAALSSEDAFAILRTRRGTMYDPRVVDLFIQIQPRLSAALAHLGPGETVVKRIAAAPAVAASAEPGHDVTEGVVRLLADLLPDCLCVAYEVDEKGVAAGAAAGRHAAAIHGHRLPLGHGVTGWVAANTCGIDDTDSVLDLGGSAALPDLLGTSCTSMPLALSPRPVVLTVYGPRDRASVRGSCVRNVVRFVEQLGRAGGHPLTATGTAWPRATIQ